MDGIADLGGTDGWGPIQPPQRDEPVFPETWNARAFALTVLSIRLSGHTLDAFRHSLERQDRDDYFGEGYFGRWLNAAEMMLTASSIIAPGAIEARARKLRGEQVDEPPIPEPNRPDYAPTGPGSLRTIDAAPRFAPGERVRAKDVPTHGHTRLPRYIRGHHGVVEIIQPAAVLPDTHAHFLGENAQHVYSVRFDSTELWPPGPGTDPEPFELTIEMFETYLEKVA